MRAVSEWRLYEINEILEIAIASANERIGDDGVIPDDWAQFLDCVQMERDEKALQVARYIKSCESEAEAIKAEKQCLAARQSSLETKAERLRGYLAAHIQANEKLSDASTMISWRKSDKVVVDDAVKLPKQFVEFVPKYDLFGIKAAIKAGNEVDGAHIEHKNNIQIK